MVAPMCWYRFYFLNSANHIAAASQDVDCGDDADAEQTALRMLTSQGQYGAVEIWNGRRRVSRQDRVRVSANRFSERSF